ncbi:MAG: hypothetical protein ACPHID_08220 [Thermoplasmatota archaeon]
MQAVVQHLQGLATGAFVIYVTADRPWSVMAKRLEDATGMFAVDAISGANGMVNQARQDGVMFLQSPTMLEMIAMRVEQLARRHPNAHVVVDSLNALALYNGIGPVQEFSHYLANRLRALDVSGDFIVADNAQGQALRQAVEGFVDEAVEVA